MKKTLLFIGLLSFTLSNAQVIINDNYNALTIGNFTTDVAATAAGQGGYLALGGAVGDYQVVSEGGTQGNVIQITGSATATGTKYLFKEVVTGWGSRTSGNNIIEAEFDIFTGAATTSKNTARVYIYNSDGSTPLVGLSLNLETKAISGIAYYDPNNGGVNPVNTYLFNLGAANAIINLTASTWVRIGVSYNTVTRAVVWKGPGFYVGVTGAVPATGTNSPSEVDFIHTAGTANIVAATSRFDNLFVRAVATESLLGNSDFNALDQNLISVFPNPVSDVVSISSNLNAMNSVSVIDINGRVIKNVEYNGVSNLEINISDLNSGVYFLNIATENGSATKKIIKN
jgi:hypothetical protein